jgi:hypothetical protein
VLDDVERRRFLVQPAREHSAPAPVGALDIELDECAGQRLAFPRRGRLAGPQADDDVLDPHRLAGLQGDVADDAVALVQQPEHGDPLRHRRDPRLAPGRGRDAGRHRLAVRFLLGRLVAAAAGGAERQQHQWSKGGAHAQSGIQG